MTDAGKLHKEPPKLACIPVALLHDKTITDGAKVLYAHMAWRYGRNRRNFEGQRSMAACLDVSEMTIHNRVLELERAHWVVTIFRAKSSENGKYQTPFYHVFENQKRCQQFREEYKADEGQTIRPAGVGVKVRKNRKGKGGIPTHHLNSGLARTVSTQVEVDGLNSGLDGALNSGLDELSSALTTPIGTKEQKEKEKDLTMSGDIVTMPKTESPESVSVPIEKPKPKATKRKSIDTPETLLAIRELIHEWLTATKAIDPGAYAKVGYRNLAREMYLSGVTPEDIRGYIRGLRSDNFWADKQIRLSKVAAEIMGYKAKHKTGSYTGTLICPICHTSPCTCAMDEELKKAG